MGDYNTEHTLLQYRQVEGVTLLINFAVLSMKQKRVWLLTKDTSITALTGSIVAIVKPV